MLTEVIDHYNRCANCDERIEVRVRKKVQPITIKYRSKREYKYISVYNCKLLHCKFNEV